MYLEKTVEISIGHRLPNHSSKCYNLHGHNYLIKVKIFFEDSNFIKNNQGYIVDFGEVKKIVKDNFDHKFLLYKDDEFLDQMKNLPGLLILDYIPTAENIAIDLRNKIAQKFAIDKKNIEIEIRETINSTIKL